MTPFSSGFYYRCKRKGCRSDGLKIKETDDRVWTAFETKLTDPEILYDAWRSENVMLSDDVKEAKKLIQIADGKLKLIQETKDRLGISWSRHGMSTKAYEAEMEKLEKDELYWNKEKARAENTTHDSDEMELAAEKAAQHIQNSISIVKSMKEIKASMVSLVGEDLDIQANYKDRFLKVMKQAKYKDRLIKLIKQLGESTSICANESIGTSDIKNMTHQLKRNILIEARQNGIKIISKKDGQIFFEGFLTSGIPAQTTFG
jgi:hypothetical protein